MQDAQLLKGLCEMMFDRLSEWLDAFILDMEADDESSEPLSRCATPPQQNSPQKPQQENGTSSPSGRLHTPRNSPSRRHSGAGTGGTSPRGTSSASPGHGKPALPPYLCEGCVPATAGSNPACLHSWCLSCCRYSFYQKCCDLCFKADLGALHNLSQEPCCHLDPCQL